MRVLLGHREPQAPKDPVVHKVRKAQVVHLETLVHKVRKAQLAILEQLVHRVHVGRREI